MPKPAGGSDGLPQRLQKNLIGGEDDQLDDVAREAEPQRVDAWTVIILGG
jgi:hypothetical protein